MRPSRIVQFLLIPILLIGLIVFQLWWQTQSHHRAEKEKELDVVAVLEGAAEKLENADLCVTFYSSSAIHPYQGFYTLRQQYTEEEGYHGQVDTVRMVIDPNILTDAVGNNVSIPGYRSQLPTKILATYKVLLDTSLRPDQRTESDSIWETAQADDPTIRMDTAWFYGLLRKDLDSIGVYANFGFTISDKETDKGLINMKVEDLDADFSYSVPLYDENPFVPDQVLELRLYGPVAKASSVPIMLSLGIIILLIIVVSRYYLQMREERRVYALKNDFLNNLNHEMNTPVANIQLALESFRKPIDDVRKDRLLDIMESESRRLKVNIDRSLQIGLLETDQLQLERSSFDIIQVLGDLVEAFSPSVAAVGGSIQMNNEESSIVVEGDPVHLPNAVANLIDNAIKYRSADRKLKLSVKIVKENGGVKIVVEDNGIGMEDNQLSKVFDKFYRVEGGLTSKRSGFGIGLSYTKAIAGLHHGYVEAMSAIDKYTKVILFIPISGPYPKT